MSSVEVHVLASGSDGNCTVVSTEDTMIMLDAGISGKRIVASMARMGLDPESLDAILLTHEHSDHVIGAGILSRRFNIPICCNRSTLACSNIGAVHDTLLFETGKRFEIGCLSVDPLPISHNAADPNSFHVHCENKNVLLATDLGKVGAEVFAALREADLAIIEANHDVQMLINGPYPPRLKGDIRSDRGHLSNVDCAHALWATWNEKRKVFLAHLSKNNNTPILARRTVSRTLGCAEEKIDCMMCPDDLRTIIL